MWKIVRKTRWRLVCVVCCGVCILLLLLLTRSKCGIRGNLKKSEITRGMDDDNKARQRHDHLGILGPRSLPEGASSEYSPNDYKQWAEVFQNIINPLIFYTNSKDFKLLVEKYREKFRNKTKIILITDRKEFWPFQISKEIQAVFQQPNIPKYYPNTVMPEYSASQHAKYAVLADAFKQNIFHTEFYAWLNVGYFGDATCEGENHYFRMNPPPEVDKTRLSINLVNQSLTKNVSFDSIYKEKYVWVGGGMLVATKDVFLKFERLYHRAVVYFLRRRLMNSDQQLIYGIYCDEGRRVFSPEVNLQLFWSSGFRKVWTRNTWFYLGYLCLEDI
eukprot:XP_019919801.1 PREDICTED: uncharacterized protein LOC109617685 [Crassostrea gigas]